MASDSVSPDIPATSTERASRSKEVPETGSVGEVFAAFLKLGLTSFGGPIAHGFLTLSLLPGLNPPGARIVGHGNATNYGSEGLRFLAPVPEPAGLAVLGSALAAMVALRRRDRTASLTKN